MRMSQEETPEHVVFYDGDCGFCNSSVQFILEKENSISILFRFKQKSRKNGWVIEMYRLH